MIELMQIAINKISLLSEGEQKELANLIEQELEWQQLDVETDLKLEDLADEAIEEFTAGNTTDDAW